MTHAELKAQISDLLIENHPAELARLTGADDTTCKKIVHELYMERFNDPNCWHVVTVRRNLGYLRQHN